jgi:hypothetical protein
VRIEKQYVCCVRLQDVGHIGHRVGAFVECDGDRLRPAQGAVAGKVIEFERLLDIGDVV